MRIPEKPNALYVRGVVIPCGLSDATNDKPVSKEDIRKIFTNYTTHETDVQHTFIKNFGVNTLENTLTETETKIAGQTVPANSWIASVMIVNPEIKKMVEDGNLNGFSLGAVGEEGLNENVNFLNKSLRYEDLNDADELNPLFISLVDKPANQFNWEVLSYDSFLAKSKNFGDTMTNEEKKETTIKEGYVSESFLERTMNKFLAKSEDAEPKEEETLEKSEEEESKEEEDKLEKAEDDISNAQLLEQLPKAVAEAVVSALKEEVKNEPPKKEDEETLEKSEDEQDEEDKTLEKSEEETKEGIKDSEKTMTKSTTKIVDNSINDETTEPSFLNSKTRDRNGRNKKYL